MLRDPEQQDLEYVYPGRTHPGVYNPYSKEFGDTAASTVLACYTIHLAYCAMTMYHSSRSTAIHRQAGAPYRWWLR